VIRDPALGRGKSAAMWAVLIGVPAVSIALLLDRRSMWMDEATSMFVASRDFAGMAEILRHVDAVFAFYYVVLHAWLAFGNGTVYARLLSSLFAIAALPFVFAMTRRLVNRDAAFLATLTLGTSYTFLRYAVETRPYSLEILLCAISGYCFVSLLDAPRRRTFAAYAAGTLLAIYAHPLAILWPFAHVVSLAVVPRSRALLRGFALSAVAVGIGLLPLAAGVRLNGTRQIDWIPPMTFERVLQFFQVLAAGDGGGSFHHGELAAGIALCTLAGAIVVLRSVGTPLARVLPIWLLLPVVAMLTISVWKPVDESRYFCYLVLPAFMLTGVALDTLRRSAGRVACLIAIVALIFGGVAQMLNYQGENWRAASAFLDRAAPSDGVIVYTENALRPLLYAQNERGIPLRGVLIYPRIVPWIGDQNHQPVPADLSQRAARLYPRVWVVLSHRPSAWESAILGPMRRLYDDVQTEDLGLIEVHELRARASRR
jgi:uncharacterized membrane protein